MIGSNLARLALTALLAGLVSTGWIHLWMLYAFALLFGLADAFFFPAQTSIVPQLVAKDQLQAGNAMIQGTATLSLFVGPVLAGAMIAWLGQGSTRTLTGIALAFAVDALSFLASVTTLSLMRIEPAAARAPRIEGGVLTSIREGLLYVWNDPTLRIVFGLITWLQTRISPAMTGRIMSLIMFASVGLNPISTAVAGALIGLNAAALLVSAGSLMTIFTLASASLACSAPRQPTPGQRCWPRFASADPAASARNNAGHLPGLRPGTAHSPASPSCGSGRSPVAGRPPSASSRARSRSTSYSSRQTRHWPRCWRSLGRRSTAGWPCSSRSTYSDS